MNKPVELHTGRLRLRQWRLADRESFAALNADPRVMEYFPSILNREASDVMADRCESLISQQGWGFWALELIENSEFIGMAGLHIPSPDLPCSPCVEIGWRLAFTHWGKGYATEAARAALRFGFESLDLPEIVSFTTLGNHRSRAVMERIGMVDTGEIFQHPHVPEDSLLRPHRLYRMTQAQWREQSGAMPV